MLSQYATKDNRHKKQNDEDRVSMVELNEAVRKKKGEFERTI
jgi:hypothetical protein